MDLGALKDAVIAGDLKGCTILTEVAIQAGHAPQKILNEALVPGMEVVGEKFRCNELYVPEVLVTARAMKKSLAMLKPLILRPVLINAEKNRDTLGLMAALRKRLRDESYAKARGDTAGPSAIFVDEEELPGAITPSGSYTVSGTRVVVKLVLSRDDKEVTSFQVEGSTEDLTGLVAKIVEAILQASKTI